MKHSTNRRKRARRQGFTIIELVVVALIIGMLAVFVVPNVAKKFGKAKSNIARGKMALIEGKLVEFLLDCGRFPSSTEGLDALMVAPPDLEEKWDGPYAKESELADPWGNRYVYLAEGVVNEGGYDLISYGADGTEGGEGENADIVND